MLSDIVDVLVDFVSNHDDTLMLEQDILQCLQFLLGINRTRWIRWRTKDDGTSLRRDGCF